MTLAYWNMHDMGSGSWWFMGLGGVLVWGLIVWVIATSVRDRSSASGPSTSGEILDRRLASGEISTDEHARLREALRPSTGPATVR